MLPLTVPFVKHFLPILTIGPEGGELLKNLICRTDLLFWWADG